MDKKEFKGVGKTLSVYAIYDKKVGVYGKPFCEDNDVQATRGLNIAVKDPTIQLSHFPEDFDLYQIGIYFMDEGRIAPIFPPVFIVAAISQKKLMEELERIRNATEQKEQKIEGGIRVNTDVIQQK